MTQTALVPQGPSIGVRIASASLVVLGGVAWLAVLAVFVFIVPKFIEISSRFEVQLPPMTQLVIAVAQAFGRFGVVLVALWLMMTAALATGAALAASRWTLALSILFAAASFIAVLVVLTLMMIGLFQPLGCLVEVLGGRR